MTDLATHDRWASQSAPTQPTSSDDRFDRRHAGPTDRPGRQGFRPGGRRRARIAAGVVLGAVAVAANLVLYAGLDDRVPAVQVVRDVPAGALISDADVRTVDVDLDASVPVVSDPSEVVGRYAEVRMVSGSLVTPTSLRATPLVTPDAAVVAVRVPDGALPSGLRERVPVRLVLAPSASTAGDETVAAVPGRVVGLPTSAESSPGVLSLSVEVAVDDATAVAAADDVRVVLLDPAPDPAGSEVGE